MKFQTSPPIQIRLLKKLYENLRANLVIFTPRPLRRLFYKKPTDWDQFTYLHKVKWRCHNPDPKVDYGKLMDKLRVKEVVGPYFDVPRTYDTVVYPRNIDLEKLPKTYVMKATHGWNMNLLVIDGTIRGQNWDASFFGKSASLENLKKIATQWLTFSTRELLKAQEIQYGYVKPRIIFEEYVAVDYELQMFMFDGICQITMVLIRKFNFLGQPAPRFRLYDNEWCRIDPGSVSAAPKHDNSPKEIPAPDPVFLQRLNLVCKDFDHVRADFLVSNGRPYFSEFTFTHNAGKSSLLGQYEDTLGIFWH